MEPTDQQTSKKLKIADLASADDLWKWIAAALLSVVMFMLGGFVDNIKQQSQLTKHAEQAGHPIMEERVNHLDQVINLKLQQIDQRLQRIETKLER